MAIPKKKSIQNKPVGNIDWKRELVMTFSNGRSMLSSKKIERFVVFTTFLIITIVYIIMNIRTLESFDLVEILGIWFAYIGVHSFINQRDRRMDREQNRPDSIE